MKMKMIKLFLSTSIFLLISCSNNPQIIESEDATQDGTTGIFDNNKKPKQGTINSHSSDEEGMHTVEVLEVLPTSKYVYLSVKENEDKYWIATIKQEVKVGDKYMYSGGLLKTNFKSREFNRVFDRVYLVSQIISLKNGNTNNTLKKELSTKDKKYKKNNIDKSLKIAAIVKDPKKYEGKEIQISGECTKVNPNIMGRNWVHLNDGTNEDFDFVVTTKAIISEGSIVTLKGVVALNKDFGAGYKYSIIVENGEILK